MRKRDKKKVKTERGDETVTRKVRRDQWAKGAMEGKK